MIKPFVLFLAEAKKHATTGHLDHVEALLYQDPDLALKHHVLDQFRTHADQFDLETDRGEEHEGIVSDVDGHQAKFVREGPDGFPKKNADNLRFGSREA